MGSGVMGKYVVRCCDIRLDPLKLCSRESNERDLPHDGRGNYVGGALSVINSIK